MAGGKIRVLWDRDETAVVNIYGASGAVSTAFSVNGSPVSFPYNLTADTTFTTDKGDNYSLSVKLNSVEIASETDGQRVIPLINGEAECVVAPSPEDGFVSPTAGSGGGFDESGTGAPTTDPTTVDPGYTYLDTESGCLYVVSRFADENFWNRVGGEINGANTMQGLILGSGAVLAGKSKSGPQVIITDVDAYENSGNGIIWRGAGGGDGAQSVQMKTGTGGFLFSVSNPDTPVTAWQAFNDGSSEFGGVVYFDQNINLTAQALPADGDINAGQVFVAFDSTDGAAKIRFKGKSADGTVVSGNVALS